MARKRSVSVRDYKAIVRSFHRESDRSAAILASSFLECYLGDHLRAFLVADKVVDNFLDNSMESLYARSILAYAIGLISKEMLDDIDVVRSIRNIFAHQPEDCNFDSKEIREKCSKLSTAKPIPVEGGGEYV